MNYEEVLEFAKGGLEVYEKDYSELTEQIEFQKLVIKAIEKQMHKFVNCPKGFQGTRDTRFYCPICNKLTRKHENFCHNCGQAIKYPKEVYSKENNRWYFDWSEDK